MTIGLLLLAWLTVSVGLSALLVRLLLWVPSDLPVSPVQAAAAPVERLSAALPVSPHGGSLAGRGGPPVTGGA